MEISQNNYGTTGEDYKKAPSTLSPERQQELDQLASTEKKGLQVPAIIRDHKVAAGVIAALSATIIASTVAFFTSAAFASAIKIAVTAAFVTTPYGWIALGAIALIAAIYLAVKLVQNHLKQKAEAKAEAHYDEVHSNPDLPHTPKKDVDSKSNTSQDTQPAATAPVDNDEFNCEFDHARALAARNLKVSQAPYPPLAPSVARQHHREPTQERTPAAVKRGFPEAVRIAEPTAEEPEDANWFENLDAQERDFMKRPTYVVPKTPGDILPLFAPHLLPPNDSSSSKEHVYEGKVVPQAPTSSSAPVGEVSLLEKARYVKRVVTTQRTTTAKHFPDKKNRVVTQLPTPAQQAASRFVTPAIPHANETGAPFFVAVPPPLSPQSIEAQEPKTPEGFQEYPNWPAEMKSLAQPASQLRQRKSASQSPTDSSSVGASTPDKKPLASPKKRQSPLPDFYTTMF